MADKTLQSMIADRAAGGTRARLTRYYIEQGYPPAIASAKAIMETPTAPDPNRTDIRGSDVLQPVLPRRVYQGTEQQDFRSAPPYEREAALSAYRAGMDTPGSSVAGRLAAARREAEPDPMSTIPSRFMMARAADTRLGDIGQGRDPEDSALSERDRLIRFYSDRFSPAEATRMADMDLGRRMAEKAYADAYTKLTPGKEWEPTSQFGRFVKSITDYGSTPEQREMLRRQTALNIAKNQVQGMAPVFRDQPEADYEGEVLRNKTMLDYLMSKDRVKSAPQFSYSDVEPVVQTPEQTQAAAALRPAPASAMGFFPSVEEAKRRYDQRFNAPETPAAPAPANPLSTQLGGQYNDVFNVPYNPPSGEYNDVFNVPYNPPAKAAGPAKPNVPAKTQTATQQTTSQQTASPASPESMTLSDLWRAANRSDASAADFFRADRAMMAARQKGEDIGYLPSGEGRKSGGAVQNKDAAVHKALDIIQHLLTRG